MNSFDNVYTIIWFDSISILLCRVTEIFIGLVDLQGVDIFLQALTRHSSIPCSSVALEKHSLFDDPSRVEAKEG